MIYGIVECTSECSAKFIEEGWALSSSKTLLEQLVDKLNEEISNGEDEIRYYVEKYFRG